MVDSARTLALPVMRKLLRRPSKTIVRTLAELDAKIAECDAAEAVSDDAMRAVFHSFEMQPPADLPADPFSPQYASRQMELYRMVAGKDYAPANEVTSFDVEAAIQSGFPWQTQSCATAGEYFGGISSLLKSMDVAPGSRIVEFGPGWGHTTEMLAKLGHHVTAIDIEERFCELIRKKTAALQTPVEVIHGDFLSIEASNAQWDAAVFFECFHHCADHLRLLRALHKVIAPGGAIYFAAEPIEPTFPSPWGLRLDGNSLWAIRKQGWLELGFRRDYFEQALRKSGFEPSVRDYGKGGWNRVWVGLRR